MAKTRSQTQGCFSARMPQNKPNTTQGNNWFCLLAGHLLTPDKHLYWYLPVPTSSWTDIFSLAYFIIQILFCLSPKQKESKNLYHYSEWNQERLFKWNKLILDRLTDDSPEKKHECSVWGGEHSVCRKRRGCSKLCTGETSWGHSAGHVAGVWEARGIQVWRSRK